MTTAFGPFRTATTSHQGPRETNQDTVLSIDLPGNRWLLAVADGMGGLEEGELASKTALGAFYRALSSGERLSDAVGKANEAVVREAKGRTMGTTLVAAVFSDRGAEIVNVGDSRAYVSDPLGLIQITRDHTLAEEATRQGAVPSGHEGEEDTRWGSALARYLGGGREVEPDHFGPMEISEGGWLLLSSDGLHGVLSSDEIQAVLEDAKNPETAAETLVDEALRRGTQDNVSVALAQCLNANRWMGSDSQVTDEDSEPSPRRSDRSGDDGLTSGGPVPSGPDQPMPAGQDQPMQARPDPPTPSKGSSRTSLDSGRKTTPPAAPGPPRGQRSPVRKILIGPRRPARKGKGLGKLFRVLLIVVPLAIAVAFILNWILSPGP